MKWLEVQIMTTPQNEDIVSSILYNYGATGLVIDSCDKIRPINEQTYYIPVYLI